MGLRNNAISNVLSFEQALPGLKLPWWSLSAHSEVCLLQIALYLRRPASAPWSQPLSYLRSRVPVDWALSSVLSLTGLWLAPEQITSPSHFVDILSRFLQSCHEDKKNISVIPVVPLWFIDKRKCLVFLACLIFSLWSHLPHLRGCLLSGSYWLQIFGALFHS